MKNRSFLIVLFTMAALAFNAYALTASEALAKSQAWFNSGKAWSLDFQVQIFYSESPDIVSQKGTLLVADGDRFKLNIAGIEFVSDGESLWHDSPRGCVPDGCS